MLMKLFGFAFSRVKAGRFRLESSPTAVSSPNPYSSTYVFSRFGDETPKIDVKNDYLNTSNLKVPINDSQDARLIASPDFEMLPVRF